MTSPVFGLEFIQQNDQPIPVNGANLDVVGIIGPCSTADPTVFPFDTPVLVYSNDTATLAKLGTDGYIPDAINGINDQLADFEIAAQLVIVITRYGTNADANLKMQQTIANIMGSSVAGTGVHAFAKAPQLLYCTPRLICAPGYTGQLANSLDTLIIGTSGIGYVPNQTYQVIFTAGGGETNGANLVLPIAHAVADANGQIHEQNVVIDSFGAWMTAAPTATLPVPDGPPVVAVAAQGALIFQRQPGVGSGINFNGSNVTFVSSGASGLQVNLGADLAATLANLMTLLTTSSDTQIAANNYALIGGTITITQKATGTAGNAFTLASTVTGLSLSGATLTGGVDAAAATRATLTATIALGANPVCAELAGGTLDGLIGHAVVESAGSSFIGDLNWRTTLNSQRLIGLSGGVKVQDPTSGDIIVRPYAPRVIGTIIARDFATGAPFHSAANQPIQGIVGPARTISFSLTDGATEGQQLLAANLGILVRGQVGVETAISSGGFVFIGTDNLGDDPEWQFYNVKRGRDFIHLSMMPTLRVFLGRSNIDRQTVNNVVMTIRDFLNQLQALQHILGSKVTFNGSLNSASEIRLGHLVVSFAAEEPPVLRRITTMSSRYKAAIDTMVADLEQQLNIGG